MIPAKEVNLKMLIPSLSICHPAGISTLLKQNQFQRKFCFPEILRMKNHDKKAGLQGLKILYHQKPEKRYSPAMVTNRWNNSFE